MPPFHNQRSENGTPAFALLTFGLSTMVTTTASGGASKFLTTASVISFINARFCSGVRPLNGVDEHFRHVCLPRWRVRLS